MDKLLLHWSVYLLPFGEVIFALLVGLFFVKRSKRSNHGILWSIGTSLICTSVFSALLLSWFYLYMSEVASWGALLYILTPLIPVGIIGLGSIFVFSGLTVWGGRENGFFDRTGYANKPTKILIQAARGVLILCFLTGIYLLLPIIHLLPYREFSYETRTGENAPIGATVFEQKLTVMGLRYTADKHDNLLVLHNSNWPEYDPSFQLHGLDWLGRIKLRVRHVNLNTQTEDTQTYYLPFEKSTYHLKGGKPVRAD